MHHTDKLTYFISNYRPVESFRIQNDYYHMMLVLLKYIYVSKIYGKMQRKFVEELSYTIDTQALKAMYYLPFLSSG